MILTITKSPWGPDDHPHPTAWGRPHSGLGTSRQTWDLKGFPLQSWGRGDVRQMERGEQRLLKLSARCPNLAISAGEMRVFTQARNMMPRERVQNGHS